MLFDGFSSFTGDDVNYNISTLTYEKCFILQKCLTLNFIL